MLHSSSPLLLLCGVVVTYTKGLTPGHDVLLHYDEVSRIQTMNVWMFSLFTRHAGYVFV